MSTKETILEKLAQHLRIQGIAQSGAIVRDLEISKATLSRAASSLPPQFLKFGKASNTHFALLRELPQVGSELPIFRVDEKGSMQVDSKVYLCQNQRFLIEPGEKIFSGLPPHFAEMAPQGFMGRAFAQKFSEEINLPARPSDWSNDHLLIAIARRGEDLPGNLIVGQESAQRFRQLEFEESKKSSYVAMAKAAIQGEPAGSSAGGEQPKFSAFIAGKSVLVKFAGINASENQQRWKDLLVCEHHALTLLSENKIESAKSELYEKGEMLFLEVERFDRVGIRGRKAVLTLASIDDYHFGSRDQWSIAADRFLKAGFIGKDDTLKIKLLDAFGMLIADSDRHFHNISFFPLKENKFILAPAFDKLPMFYAPAAGSGEVLERKFIMPVPNAQMIEVWNQALVLAEEFWNRISSDSRISSEFRKMARENKAFF